MEVDLGRKTTFCGRQPLLEDDLLRTMTLGGNQPLVDFGFSTKRFYSVEF